MTRRERPTAPDRLDRWQTAIAVTLVAALTGLSLVFFGQSRDAAAAEAVDADIAAQLEVQIVRAELLWLHQDLLADGMAAATAGADLDAERMQTFQRDVGEKVERLDELAEGPGQAAELAGLLVESFRAEGGGSGQVSWPDLIFAEEPLLYPALPADLADGVSSVDEALYLTVLPSYLLLDAAAVNLSLDPTAELSQGQADVVFELATIVAAAPGPWLGVDRSDPLQDFSGAVVDGQGANLLDAVVGSARSTPAHQSLWDYDDWLFSGGREIGLPEPLSVQQLQAQVNEANLATRTAFLEQLAATGSGPSSAETVRTSWLWMAATVGVGLAALAVVALMVVRHRAERRSLEADALTDPLTGAHNRRFLDQEVAGRCLRRRHHHLVAMVDLDRFKQLNDTWGHDAGDAMLRHVADGLAAVARAYEQSAQSASAAVIRLGGDEFAIVINAPDRCNPMELTARVRSLAGPVDLGLPQPVGLEFSVGVAEVDYPVDIVDLMKVADLATYEDKRARGRGRDAVPTVTPAVIADAGT